MVAFWTLLAFGGFWFWAAFLIVSFFIIVFLENDRSGGATLLTLLAIAAMVGLGNMGVFTWIAAHPFLLIGYLGGYFAVGCLYGGIKWWLKLRDTADRYKAARTKWLERQIEVVRPERKSDYKEALRTGILTGNVKKNWIKEFEDLYANHRLKKPMVSQNKGRIISWMTYWPWSGLWTLINDPIRRTFRFLYSRISSTLQRMSDRIFADIQDELEPDVEETE